MKIKKNLFLICFLLTITCILLYPYLTSDFLPIEHDTFFHLSRIEHLSQEIGKGNWIPAVYINENLGFGYSSPLFYSDVLLIPFALLHNLGLALSSTYKVTIFVISFLSAYTMYHCAKTLTLKTNIGYLCAITYLFCNYHITDIYVRGALGELFAMVFLPLILEGMIAILVQDKKSYTLGIGLTGLALSHNLTFLLGVVLCILLFLIFIQKCTKKKFFLLAIQIGIAFLLTLFFTIPMLEQLKVQKLILSIGTDLASNTIRWWQLFTNEIIFGYSGNTLPYKQSMTVNVGWTLTFAPIFLLLDHHKKGHTWIYVLLCIGYIALLLPLEIFPWSSFDFLSSMQFPWRLNTIAMLCLCIPASYAITLLLNQKMYQICFILLLCVECAYHVLPVTGRTFGIYNNQTWQDVLDGKLCDPCYSADYVRVELAGGDYLPIYHVDYRTYPYTIKDENSVDTPIQLTNNGSNLTFVVTEETSTKLELPITYYPGYKLTRIRDHTDIPLTSTIYGLTQTPNLESGTYVLEYVGTTCRHICMWISFITLLCTITYTGYQIIRKHRKQV